MIDQRTIQQVTQVLGENYLSLGATKDTALRGLAEDLRENRIDAEDLECQYEELLVAVGQLLASIIDFEE